MRQRAFFLTVLFLLVAATVVTAGRSSAAVTTVGPDLSPYPWFYLRDGQPLASGEEPVALLLAGDLSFGRETAAGFRPIAGDSLTAVAPWVREADLALANLESPLVPTGLLAAVPAAAFRLRGEPAAALAIAAAGFDLLSVANNHAGDYGPAGLAASSLRLRQLGVTPVGGEPLVRQVQGLRIAFLAFNQVASAAPRIELPATATMIGAVRRAQTQADLVVVSLHWGYEYELRPDPAQVRLAEALRAAGADVIAGHHPHVVQPLSLSDGGLVAYSLGNFLFDQEEGEMTQGLVLRVLLDRDGLRAVQGLPLHAGLHPHLLAPAAAAPLLARVAPPPPRVGFTAAGATFKPLAVAQDAASGLFWSGQSDLTGDGQPEQIRREGGRVRVYEGGALVWESPPAWEVVDVALGDPNDDGRKEMMLAVWKADAAGYRRSHPYLVGYRAGAYTLMWGGRAVMDPLRELTLGDVDGDGRQELLVLLERADGAGTVLAVWRWHGWGFTLLWQSAPGPYRDLLFQAAAAGQPPAFSAALATAEP